MRRDLPPLTALLAFEAAGRHLNFTRAAEELNVTQPAISHQVNLLESDLGLRLFSRNGRQVSLTESGQILFRVVTESLGNMAEVSRSIRAARNQGTVTIATNPGVAAFWLTPRLESLRASLVGLNVRVLTSDSDRHLPLSDVDIAIRFGSGRWPDAEAELAMPERVAPVCAPGYGGRNIWTVRDIWEDAALIHQEDDENRWFTWEDWRCHWCPEAPPAKPWVVFSNYSLGILQTIAGKGISLGWLPMLESLFEAGSLIALDDFRITSERGYFIVRSLDRPIRDEVRAVRDWLLESLP